VDVAIDTFPFAGGNTTFQSLGVGTPLITLPNDFMRSRCAVGAYNQIGFEELVARDPAHYAELAVRVANDREFRAHCVEAIRDGESRLFETEQVINEFNEFFASAYEASFKEGALA
jgi:protein O-GlcNAc transferase